MRGIFAELNRAKMNLQACHFYFFFTNFNRNLRYDIFGYSLVTVSLKLNTKMQIINITFISKSIFPNSPSSSNTTKIIMKNINSPNEISRPMQYPINLKIANILAAALELQQQQTITELILLILPAIAF